MAQRSLASLSVDELCSYLLARLPDLERETIEAFRFHKVNGETFLQLTDDDIRELTARLGERKAIKRLIDSPPDMIYLPQQHMLAEPHIPPHKPVACCPSFVACDSLSNTSPQPSLCYVTMGRHGNVSKTPPPDPQKYSQASGHPIVPLRAPVAPPTTTVKSRAPQATPLSLHSCPVSAAPALQTPLVPIATVQSPCVSVATVAVQSPSVSVATVAGGSNWIRSFKIPDFSFRTQQALKSGVITKGASSDIVTYLAHHIWTHTKYPSSEEYTEVCRELVTKHPVLKDGTSTGYVSWKRRLQQKFKNLRRPSRGARLRRREGAVPVGVSPGFQLGVAERGEGHEVDLSESEGDEDGGDVYSMTSPHRSGSPEGEEPLKKRLKESPDQSTRVMISADGHHGSTPCSSRDGSCDPLHIEEMSSFYNDSPVSSYQDGWTDVKVKVEET